jgi:hypothetical protein
MDAKWWVRLVVVGGVLAGGGVLAYKLLFPKPAPQPLGSNFDPNKPAIEVTTATGYNPVQYQQKELDLSRYAGEFQWRYQGTVVVP